MSCKFTPSPKLINIDITKQEDDAIFEYKKALEMLDNSKKVVVARRMDLFTSVATNRIVQSPDAANKRFNEIVKSIDCES